MANEPHPTGIDKDALYGDFRKHQEKRNALALKAAHKALDLADDDMHIEANQHHYGVGAKGLIALGLLTLVPSAIALVAAFRLFPGGEKEKPPAVTAPAEKPGEKPGAWDAITEELQPDGTWKQIKRERLK